MASKFGRLKISKAQLNDELSQQASAFANIAEAAEIAHDQMDTLELKMEFLEQDMIETVTQKYRNVNPKLRPGITEIKAMAKNTPEFRKLREAYKDAVSTYRMAKVGVEAQKMRAEMLVSMAHNMRQERKSSENNPKV